MTDLGISSHLLPIRPTECNNVVLHPNTSLLQVKYLNCKEILLHRTQGTRRLMTSIQYSLKRVLLQVAKTRKIHHRLPAQDSI